MSIQQIELKADNFSLQAAKEGLTPTHCVANRVAIKNGAVDLSTSWKLGSLTVQNGHACEFTTGLGINLQRVSLGGI